MSIGRGTCTYVCMCCRRRYLHYCIRHTTGMCAFICMFVHVRTHVCMHVIIIMFVCVVGGGTCIRGSHGPNYLSPWLSQTGPHTDTGTGRPPSRGHTQSPRSPPRHGTQTSCLPGHVHIVIERQIIDYKYTPVLIGIKRKHN